MKGYKRTKDLLTDHNSNQISQFHCPTCTFMSYNTMSFLLCIVAALFYTITFNPVIGNCLEGIHRCYHCSTLILSYRVY